MKGKAKVSDDQGVEESWPAQVVTPKGSFLRRPLKAEMARLDMLGMRPRSGLQMALFAKPSKSRVLPEGWEGLCTTRL